VTDAIVKPFPVDPEVMKRIRPMAQRDISRVVALHKAMGHSLWAELGTKFLMTLYEGLLSHPDFIGFVYEESPRVRGMIAGSSNSKKLFRDVFHSQAGSLALPVLTGIMRHPSLIFPLLSTPKYFNRSTGQAEDVQAESMFCSFDAELRGKRVSGHINKVLYDELLQRGHRHVKVTTEIDNQGAIRQLTSWGFQSRGTFKFYSKKMVVYVLDLQKSERVEAISRYPGPIRILHYS